ncbi:hypothetical protein JCM15519_38820 [Fundidesulfovibrio butyratiphilus]
MDRTYQHLIQMDGTYLVQEVRADGLTRIVAAAHPTYLAWLAAGGVAEEVAYVVPEPLSLPDARSTRKEDVAALRRQKVDGGVLYQGALIGTDDDDRATLQGAESYLAKKPAGATVNWRAKGGTTWIVLDLVAVQALGVAVGDFVQACFDAEKIHCSALDALASSEEVLAYDISTGWPEA